MVGSEGQRSERTATDKTPTATYATGNEWTATYERGAVGHERFNCRVSQQRQQMAVGHEWTTAECQLQRAMGGQQPILLQR